MNETWKQLYTHEKKTTFFSPKKFMATVFDKKSCLTIPVCDVLYGGDVTENSNIKYELPIQPATDRPRR